MLNESVAYRNTATNFRALKTAAEQRGDIQIGDSVVTKRLQARGVNVYSTPVSMSPGFIRKLGRINFAAAISAHDPEAVAALKEERERRQREIEARNAK